MPTMGPSLLRVSNAAASAASSDTSQAIPRRPADTFPDRDNAVTLAPRRARSLAIAAPMPRLAPVTMIQPSRIAEIRFPFFDEGRHAFLGVRRPVGQRRKLHFRLEALAERKLRRALNRGAGKSECRQTKPRDLTRKGHAGLERIAVDQPMHQPDAKRRSEEHTSELQSLR